MSSLKYYNAYNNLRHNKPKDTYKEDLIAIFDETFENAPNVFYNEIEIEQSYGSGIFEKIDIVRVDSVVDYNSSMVVDGDDYKRFLFKPNFNKKLVYGVKFKWNNNYWLVINTNNAESLNLSVEVRRCNNVLRFFDNYGNKIYEPCIIDTTLRFANNNDNSQVVNGNGERKIWCQRNNNTTTIKPNDKFLFGTPNQRHAVRVYAGGKKNDLNTETMNDLSPSLIEFYVEHYEVNNETDDLINGFANANENNYSIILDEYFDSYQINYTGKFNAYLLNNGKTIQEQLKWKSSNDNLIQIDNNGNFNTIGLGDVTVTVYMDKNENVYKDIELSIVNNPIIDDYKIIITPDLDYILQGNTNVYECWLYKNGEKQNNILDIYNDTLNVPIKNYSFNIINGNSFSLANNKMYMDYPVIIRCSDGERENIISISLRGLY